MASNLVFRVNGGEKVLRRYSPEDNFLPVAYEESIPYDITGVQSKSHNVVIEPETISVSYQNDGWFGVSSTFNDQYDVIDLTSNMDPSRSVNPDLLEEYTHIVTFDSRFVDWTMPVSVEYTPVLGTWNMYRIGSPLIGYKNSAYDSNLGEIQANAITWSNIFSWAMIGGSVIGGTLTALATSRFNKIYQHPYEYSPIWTGVEWGTPNGTDVINAYNAGAFTLGNGLLVAKNVTLLRLWYDQKGQPKESVLIDSYNDSKGLIQINSPETVENDNGIDPFKVMLGVLIVAAILVVVYLVMTYFRPILMALKFILHALSSIVYFVLVYWWLAIITLITKKYIPPFRPWRF